MGLLFFKKQLQTAIREGRKSTTLRRWDKPRVCVGRRAYAVGVGWLNVFSVEPVAPDQMTDADARADGFDSRDALLAALAALYPDAGEDGKRWYLVRFAVDQLETPRPRASGKRPERSATEASPNRPHARQNFGSRVTNVATADSRR